MAVAATDKVWRQCGWRWRVCKGSISGTETVLFSEAISIMCVDQCQHSVVYIDGSLILRHEVALGITRRYEEGLRGLSILDTTRSDHRVRTVALHTEMPLSKGRYAGHREVRRL